MSRALCLNCFRIKGEYEVCLHCGYQEGAPPQAVFQLKPGTILQDRYIIGGAIGYGGFGITYRAFDTQLNIVVAIKEFYPAGLVKRAEGETWVGGIVNKADEFLKLKKRFIDEARNMALFEREKDIVNVLACFEDNGTSYMIMEYVGSPLLKTKLQRDGQMQEEQACAYICALLEAIQKIHDKGIIHKDISPDNIFVTGPDQIKVFDFGAAKLQNGENEQNLSVVVKPGYAPPEQYRSKSKQDCRMDIYAAGAVLYQMLTGERPLESLERNEKDSLLPPSKRGIKVQSHVERALMKALALNPEERFESATEFKNALTTAKKKGWKWW